MNDIYVYTVTYTRKFPESECTTVLCAYQSKSDANAYIAKMASTRVKLGLAARAKVFTDSAYVLDEKTGGILEEYRVSETPFIEH